MHVSDVVSHAAVVRRHLGTARAGSWQTRAVVLAGAVLAAVAGGSAPAALVTWAGGSSPASGLWNTAGNWSTTPGATGDGLVFVGETLTTSTNNLVTTATSVLFANDGTAG